MASESCVIERVFAPQVVIVDMFTHLDVLGCNADRPPILEDLIAFGSSDDTNFVSSRDVSFEFDWAGGGIAVDGFTSCESAECNDAVIRWMKANPSFA